MRSPRELRPTALALAFLLLPLVGSARELDYQDHVVALRVTRQHWDEYRPWSKKNAEVRRGAAVVIAPKLLLAEANMIHGATLIQVEKHGRSMNYPARRVHVDAEADLALLTVDDESFFDDLSPVPIATGAPAQGELHSVRWRERQLEVSSSRVGRIEVRQTPNGSVSHAFLLMTTDFDGGGWSEPVFAGSALVGLTVSQENKLATVIPAEVLAAYANRIRGAEARERYRGFAVFGALWQVNTDRALTSFFGLEGAARGVFIRQVHRGSTACSGLAPRDILLELDGRAIDASGNYRHERYGHLRFHHLLVEGHEVGDVVSARVLRAGEVIALDLELRSYPTAARLIPWRRPDEAPPYLVAGGLVLRELDGRYLSAWGQEWRKAVPVQLSYQNDVMSHAQTPGRRRLIILSHVLPSPYNQGYHDLHALPVASINGRSIGGIADAEEAFAHPERGLHRISFYPNAAVSEIVLDAARFERATHEILSAYEIPSRLRVRARPLPPLGAVCKGGG